MEREKTARKHKGRKRRQRKQKGRIK